MTYGWGQYGALRSPMEDGMAVISPERMDDKCTGKAHYELLILPGGTPASEITGFSEMLTNRYPSKNYEGPHILLADFRAWESMESTLIRWIQRICSDTTCFNLSLNNFGGIPPSTICIRIPDSGPLRKLIGKLHVIEGYIDNGNGQPVNWNLRPQLCLSGPLPEQVYREAVLDWACMEYNVDLPISRMILKKTGRSGQGQIVNIFGFHPGNLEKDRAS